MNDPRETLVPTLIAESVVIEDDGVRILDRRRFPFAVEWVHCPTTEDVAVAIEEMVTQSSGPFFAAAGGMVLAARVADRFDAASERRDLIRAAAQRLVDTRPTNNAIRMVVDELSGIAEEAIAGDQPLASTLEEAARASGERYLEKSRMLGRHAAALIDDGATVLTHCWGESYVTESFAAALRDGKRVEAIVTETRPYLQGARLTGHSLAEMGIRTRLITDGMAAHAMSQGMVSCYLTAADRVTLDGHVINKVGTLQLAIAANHFGIPYIATVHEPDVAAPTAADVPIEERDGDEVLHTLGRRTASELLTGYYPAFDVTPPHLVSVVATARGRFSPYDLRSAVDPGEEHR